MWTKENRDHRDRSRLHYPGDLTDEEWVLAEPPIAPAKGGGSKCTIDMRKVVNGLMDVPSVGWSDSKVTSHPCSVGASHNQSAETSDGH